MPDSAITRREFVGQGTAAAAVPESPRLWHARAAAEPRPGEQPAARQSRPPSAGP